MKVWQVTPCLILSDFHSILQEPSNTPERRRTLVGKCLFHDHNMKRHPRLKPQFFRQELSMVLVKESWNLSCHKGQRKNLRVLLRIDPPIFGFYTPMQYHRTKKTSSCKLGDYQDLMWCNICISSDTCPVQDPTFCN